MTVWHNDTFGRNDFLGEVTLPLDYYEFGDSSDQWYKLQERVCLLPLVPLNCRGEAGQLSLRCTATFVIFFHFSLLLAFSLNFSCSSAFLRSLYDV